ncbi:phosphatidate cytidylyltransferase [Planctomycetota bacterium]|nr:phosphatidate cytidylyltransferase [Planctomycetota bacterium]
MGQRITLGILVVLVLGGMMYADQTLENSWFLYAIGHLVLLTNIKEISSLLQKRGLPFNPLLLGATAIVMLAYVQLIAQPPTMGTFKSLAHGQPSYLFDLPPLHRQLLLFFPLAVIPIYALHGLRDKNVATLAPRIVVNLGVFLYLVLPITLMLWLHKVPGTGPWLLYFLLASSRFGDVGAYLMGRLVGRHKLIPHLSAGKTIEGSFFGILFSGLGGIIIFLWAWDYSPALQQVFVHWWMGGVAGMFVGIAGQAGDLVASGLKRMANVKDSGSLLPGFGGMLDMTDNFMLTTPLVILMLMLWP